MYPFWLADNTRSALSPEAAFDFTGFSGNELEQIEHSRIIGKMKSLRNNFLGATLAGLAVSFGCGSGLLAAPTNDTPQILFLHLQLKNKNISLLKITMAAGVVKPSRFVQEGIQFEVISTAGESLWKETVADPRERRFEYETPPRSGRLKRKTVHIDDMEFTVRVPAFSTAKQIDFHLLKPAAAGQPEKNVLGKNLGSVMLPPSQSPPP